MRKYTKPEIEISVFATEDIITASSTTDDSTTITGLTESSALGDNTTGGVDYNSIF